ncbi:MAG: dihydroorotase [Pirellulaceae bacterium]|nr:dihydroorotase [Pirellulaceae bacterium]
MTRILIQNGRIVDPSQDLDRVSNLLLEHGKVAGIDVSTQDADETIDATGKIVAPGLIDICVELREPGWEDDETIETGTAAAIEGGFTSIACLPSTDPPTDTQANVEFIGYQALRANNCNVFVLACVSKNRAGEELAEIGSLAAAGAVGFTDANRPIFNAELMRRALEYSQMFDRPILNQPEVPELNHDGVMHEGLVSTILGLSGMPPEAEDVMTGRDIRLAEATGGSLHLLKISSSGSVELIRRAKARGVRVTAGLSLTNLVGCDESLRSFDTNLKLNPPLRSQDHLNECLAGLIDGTLDVICSGHAPRATEKKMHVFNVAPFGMISLETSLGMVGTKLVTPGHMDWPLAIRKLTTNPAQILKLAHKGSLKAGSDADVTVIDPHLKWEVDTSHFKSKSSNSPLLGWTLHGKATDVVVGGLIKKRST